jgi:hypothetical protein
VGYDRCQTSCLFTDDNIRINIYIHNKELTLTASIHDDWI